MTIKSKLVGRRYKNKAGQEVTILEMVSNGKALVEFLCTGHQVLKYVSALRSGQFLHPLDENTRNYNRTENESRLLHVHSGILERVGKFRNYLDSCVQESWTKFENFYNWCVLQKGHDIPGWELDKDILKKGNKDYKEQFCCFVPPEVNNAFTKSNKKRGKYPIGVTPTRSGKRFVAQIGGTKRKSYLGTFSTPEEAFYAYKQAKELALKELADKYKDLIDERVYQALYSYEVEITD